PPARPALAGRLPPGPARPHPRPGHALRGRDAELPEPAACAVRHARRGPRLPAVDGPRPPAPGPAPPRPPAGDQLRRPKQDLLLALARGRPRERAPFQPLPDQARPG